MIKAFVARTPGWAARPGRAGLSALLLALGMLLGSCGAGGEGTGAFAAGPVEGFGSIVLGGREYDDSQARLLIEIDPRAAEEAPLTALRLGMVGRIALDAEGRIATMRVAPELIAPVTDIDLAARRFIAGGQVVQVDATPAEPTVLEGLRDLRDLREGEIVEVHGQRGSDGVIRAGYVAQTGLARGVRVAGTLRPISDRRAQWAIGDLPIDVSLAQVLPAGRPLLAGSRVVAYTSGELMDDGYLVPQVVAVAAPDWTEGVATRLSGSITAFQSIADFRVLGLPVDATGAAFSGGSLNDLGTGRLVELDGSVTGGRLVARSVRIVPADVPPTVRVEAAVGNFVDATVFDVRQTAIDASAASLNGLSSNNIANGVPLRVIGTVGRAAVRASAVEPAPVREGRALALAGRVGSVDTASQSLRIDGGASLAVKWRADTLFIGGSAADLVPGAIVTARGTVAGGALQARELQFGPPSPEVELTGVAGGVERLGATGTFDVALVDVVWTANTVFIGPKGTSADLVEGQVVRVRGVREGAVVRALVVDARATQPGAVRIRGTVTQFNGLSSLRVDGQRVDASQAVFEPDSLRGALAGAYVDVEGRMVDGVLNATRVSDP